MITININSHTTHKFTTHTVVLQQGKDPNSQLDTRKYPINKYTGNL